MTSDISAIREQLQALQPPVNSESEPPTKAGSTAPALPSLDQSEVAWQSPQRAEMAQALRQRSTAVTGSMPSPEEMAARPSATGAAAAPLNIQHYLRRLHNEAERINQLSQQQEIAIREFQSSFHRLSLMLMKQPYAGSLRPEQFCDLQEAALTQVVQDEHQRYILTAVDLDLTSEEQQASQMAASLRARAQARSPKRRTAPSLKALLAEPLQGLTAIGRSLTATLENQSQITPLDILVWCGGGIIGRLALDLALAAFPGLWHWVIAITVGAVALGLYRLLFAPKTDVVFIARLFLALLGLGIGGQL